MSEPQKVTDRRWRFNLMAAIEQIAASRELVDLHDTELIESFFDCVTDDCSAHGAGAMTPEECAAAHNLCQALIEICGKARLAKGERISGKVVHGLEPENLVALGWFHKVQPLARSAFDLFSQRGELTEGLWNVES